jgi:hypothetical protein
MSDGQGPSRTVEPREEEEEEEEGGNDHLTTLTLMSFHTFRHWNLKLA